VQDAAKLGGYCDEQIRRILRQQPHLNVGRPGKPAILRRNVPRKAVRLVRRTDSVYDPAADAQSLMSRQGAA
jgi:hypothetical protein